MEFDTSAAAGRSLLAPRLDIDLVPALEAAACNFPNTARDRLAPDWHKAVADIAAVLDRAAVDIAEEHSDKAAAGKVAVDKVAALDIEAGAENCFDTEAATAAEALAD